MYVSVLEKDEESRMNSEPDRLKSPSASTGFETPGQHCHPNWETGLTTAAGCLPAGVGLNLGRDTSSLTECVDTRADSETTTAPAASNTVFLQSRRKPRDKKTSSEENKQFDLPVGKEESRCLEKRLYWSSFLSWGESGLGCPLFMLRVFACEYLLAVYCPYQVIFFQRAVKCGRRRQENQ